MSLRNLQALLAVAEHGAFAAAAEALGITQSAVSMRVKALEQEFGAPLLDRAHRPAVLNATGRALAPRARRIVADYEAARASLRSAREVEGRVRLGAVGSVQTALLPRVLAEVRGRHPRLAVEIVSGFSHELAGQVDRGALDAAIVSDFAPPGGDIAWRPFLRERLILIAPPDAPEAGAAALAKRYPFIRYAPRAALGRVIQQAIAAARLEVRETMQLDWLEAVEAMVQAGHGIAVVPERVVPGRVMTTVESPLRRVALAPPRFRTLGLIHRAAEGTDPMTEAIFDQLAALVRGQDVANEQATDRAD
ncbi:MAG: LysR substrate-binding domain-containing protein [Rhodospirillales bacterium]|nr:LysR substrate-binding domain-containing protein [Rhodospirillales bacterium]